MAVGPPTTEGAWLAALAEQRSGSRQPEGKDVRLARVCLEAADCGSPVKRPAATHTHRLDRIERKLDSTIKRVDDHSVRLERLEKRRT
jgi:hypothetical protein